MERTLNFILCAYLAMHQYQECGNEMHLREKIS